MTVADRETEAALRDAIAARFPDHGIFGEEFGSEGLEREILWVLDPIDGTKSFISGSPLFGMLAAVLKGGKPVAGVIRMPALGECYAGTAETGSDRDGTPLACRKGVPLERAFLCINEANGILTREPAVFERLMQAGQYRRFSYDCYPYAQLASGLVDAVIDYDLQPYDFLPVAPVVEGAGGVISDWQGKPLTLDSDGRVVAAGSAVECAGRITTHIRSNSALFEQRRNLLHKSLRPRSAGELRKAKQNAKHEENPLRDLSKCGAIIRRSTFFECYGNGPLSSSLRTTRPEHTLSQMCQKRPQPPLQMHCR